MQNAHALNQAQWNWNQNVRTQNRRANPGSGNQNQGNGQATPGWLQTGNPGVSFDRAFVRQAAAHSLLEIELGYLAQTNSSNSAIQEFGRMLVEDHTAASEAARQLAAELGANIPQLGSIQQRTVGRLASLTGEQFDRAFISANVLTHMQDIRLFQTAALRARNQSVRTFARSQLPVLVEHFVRTTEIRDTVTGAGT